MALEVSLVYYLKMRKNSKKVNVYEKGIIKQRKEQKVEENLWLFLGKIILTKLENIVHKE